MESVTKGSGIAVSVLVAATASVLLLVPGHSRAGYWRGTGPARGGMVISAVAAPSGTAGPGGGARRPDRPAVTARQPDRPAVTAPRPDRAGRPDRARPAAPRGRPAAGPGPA